jgi:hypothetical protein
MTRLLIGLTGGLYTFDLVASVALRHLQARGNQLLVSGSNGVQRKLAVLPEDVFIYGTQEVYALDFEER